jgi:hypothetical protein
MLKHDPAIVAMTDHRNQVTPAGGRNVLGRPSCYLRTQR